MQVWKGLAQVPEARPLPHYPLRLLSGDRLFLLRRNLLLVDYDYYAIQFSYIDGELRRVPLFQSVQQLCEPFLAQRDPQRFARTHRARTNGDDQAVVLELAEQRAQRRVVRRDEMVSREIEQHIVPDRHLTRLRRRRRVHHYCTTAAVAVASCVSECFELPPAHKHK